MTRAAIAALLIGICLGTAGCQPAVKPAPGLAALRVQVIAEPKAGAPADYSHVEVYDSPAKEKVGAFETVNYSDLDDIVIWLEPVQAPPAQTVSPPPERSVDVNPARPAPGGVIAVFVGQKVVFHNRSPLAGAVYSVSDGNDFNLGSLPADGGGAYVVRAAGAIEVLSDPARDPVAELYAAPSRWVSATRSGKQVIFNDVPPGAYRLESWHPRLPGTEAVVTLSADSVSDASIKVSVNGLPKVK